MLKSVTVRVRTLSGRLMIVEIAGHRENVGEGLVSEREAELLEKQLLTDVEHASPESLAEERDLVRLLAVARQADPDRGDALIRRLAEKDPIFLAALRGFHRPVHSLSSSEVIPRERWELSWDALCNLFGEDVVQRRLRELSPFAQPSPHEDGIDEKTREALRLAQRYATGWRPSRFDQ